METDDKWFEKIKKRELCNLFGKLSIPTKSITLFAGENTIGKTATCLHLSKFVINNGFNVLYFDTEQKLIDRPAPNLLNSFLEENIEKFKKNFHIEYVLFNEIKKDKGEITDEINTSHFELKVKETKPDMVVIDSIYTSFANKFTHPRMRGSAIGKFLRFLRNFMIENDLAVVITTKIGRMVKDKKDVEIILGGQELLYNCDTKAKMRTDTKMGKKKIFFSVDNQNEFVLVQEYGGVLKATE